MPKSKAKRSSGWQTSPVVYTLIWAVGAAVMGWLSYTLTPALSYLKDQSQWTWDQFSFVSLLVGTLLVWSVPVLVTERLLKRSMRNWLVYTLLGTLAMMLWSDFFPGTRRCRWSRFYRLFRICGFHCFKCCGCACESIGLGCGP